MRNAQFIRIAGMAGMFGAAFWLFALSVEYAYDLFPPGEGVLFVANQLMFFVAQLCYLVVIFGLMRAGAAGDGWFGKTSLGLFLLGWAALAGALGSSLVFDSPVAEALIPLGAIASTLGGLLSGIAVAASRRLRGFWRFAPLIQGLYQFVAFLRVVLANQEPTQLTESLWTGTWFLIGLALYVSARDGGDRRSSRGSPNDAPGVPWPEMGGPRIRDLHGGAEEAGGRRVGERKGSGDAAREKVGRGSANEKLGNDEFGE